MEQLELFREFNNDFVYHDDILSFSEESEKLLDSIESNLGVFSDREIELIAH
jgi:hypothetical protein